MFKVLNKTPKVEIADYPGYYPSNEPLRRCPDITKSVDITKYTPKISLEEGLKNMYDWNKDNL